MLGLPAGVGVSLVSNGWEVPTDRMKVIRCHPPRVLVVVLNWNSAGNTVECVRCVRRLDYPSFRLLVIDNGSTDDSVSVLRGLLTLPERFLALRANYGFARGMNVGLRAALAEQYDYAWLLNNDAFATPDCLTTLVEMMEATPRVVMATPRLVGTDGKEQHAGGTVELRSGAVHWLYAADLCGQAARGTWLTGTAVLLRTAALRRLGCFDPRFFAYWEDVDLSTRILEAGGDLRAVPEAVCRHVGNASSGGRESHYCLYMDIRNSWLFLRKYTPLCDLPGAFLRLLGNNLERAAFFNLQGDAAAAAVVVGALAAIFRGECGQPARLRTVRPLERLLLAHPWRVSQLARTVAGRLEAGRRRA